MRQRDIKEIMTFLTQNNITELSRTDLVDLGIKFNWTATVGQLAEELTMRGIKVNRNYNKNINKLIKTLHENWAEGII